MGLIRANDAGWTSASVVAALVAGLALLVAFVVWQRRARAPMLPPRFFRSRAFSAGNAATFLMMAALFGAVFFMAQFLQTVRGYGPFGAGLRLLPWTATLFLVGPVAGGLVNRLGERRLICVGLLLQGVGMGWVSLVASPHVAYAALVVPFMVAGCGVSMAMPAAQSAVMGAVAPEEIGKASGAFNMVRGLGGVFGVAVLAAVFAAGGGYASAHSFSHGFQLALALSAGLSLAGAIVATALPRTRPARHLAAQSVVAPSEGVA